MELPKNNIKTNQTNRGFTIVELLIASGIVLIILAIVGLIYVSSDRSFRFGQSALNSEADLRLAMDWLTRDIRAASVLETSGATVTLTIPSESGDTTVYYTWGTDKLIRTAEGETRPIALVSMDPPIINGCTVTITLRPVTGATSRTLTSQITMRNKS